jgi:8-oxo-dGTP pyrophosphatase MutT (NUDIX family)
MGVIQSAGGIIYQIAKDGDPRYLLIKRQALSKKVERVAPKGKIEAGETPEIAALREISEETGIPIKDLSLKSQVGVTSLRVAPGTKVGIEKDVTYFLIEYSGDPHALRIQDAEGRLGVYKWATIHEVLALLHYRDIRELFRETYNQILTHHKKQSVKQSFLKGIED